MRRRWSPPPAPITASVTRPGTSDGTAAGRPCWRGRTAIATASRSGRPAPLEDGGLEGSPTPRNVRGASGNLPRPSDPHKPWRPSTHQGHTLRMINRCILVCPDDFLWRLVADSREPRLVPPYLVESARPCTRIVQRRGDDLT